MEQKNVGTFRQWIEISHPANGDFHWVEALVDTGASYSMMPASLLTQELHLSPKRERTFKLADGTTKIYGWGEARFRVDGLEMNSPVVFGPENQYLLGATSLQNFDLIADTTNHRMVPSPERTL